MVRYDLADVDVLIVDNNRHMLLLLRDVLHALGVRRIRTSGSAKEALDALAAQPADLVITEWNLEPIAGPEFLTKLRDPSQSGDWQVPILLVTGYRDAGTVRQARDCGVSEFLTKPVSARILYERIVAMIEQPRPFVDARSYRGPDRRRRGTGAYEGPERRRKRRDAPAKPAGDRAP